jgi:hypothetical protein
MKSKHLDSDRPQPCSHLNILGTQDLIVEGGRSNEDGGKWARVGVAIDAVQTHGGILRTARNRRDGRREQTMAAY